MFDPQQREQAITLVQQFCADVKGSWSWDTLVEQVAPLIGVAAEGRAHEAVFAASFALRERFPGVGWRNLSPDAAGVVLDVIASEFHRVRDGAQIFDDAVVFARQNELLSKLPGYVSTLMNGAKVVGEKRDLDSAAGIYALFRNEGNRFPSYIGEAKCLRSRIPKHMSWWGPKPLLVTCLSASQFPELACYRTRVTVEGFLIAVFPGTANVD